VGTHNGAAQDWRNLSLEHSISPQDLKYSFTGEVSYDLPVGNGRAFNLNGVGNAFLGGWTVNGILYLSTGVPIASPTSGTPPGYFAQRADEVSCANSAPHSKLPNSNANAGDLLWMNYQCFVEPGAETGNPNPLVPGAAPAYLGNFRTDGARDFDVSIYKTFKFGETKALRFDISSYNLFNKAQFGYPSIPSVSTVNAAIQTAQNALPSCAPNCPVPSNPAGFGTISANVNTPRQFQFGARFTF
jgi:hypothetical protein